MTLQCVAADLKTGRILADLTSMDAGFPLTSTMSNVDTATAQLHLDGAPENWLRATKPGAAVIAFYDDTTNDNTPGALQWAGYVSSRHRDVAVDVVDLSLTTLEGYLDRRHVGDLTFTAGTGWRDIVASIVNSVIVTGGGSGLPGIDLLTLNYAPGGTALLTDLVWQNADNVTVLGRINELIGQYGGDFHVTWTWSTDLQSLVPTLNFGDRIGTAATAGLAPGVTFDLPGVVTAGVMDEDYSQGSGANVVTAYSSGQGTYTPYSDPQPVSNYDDRPAFEDRISPVASITDLARLNAYAAKEVQFSAPGKQPVSFTYSRSNDAGRKYGADWFIGDDIGYVISGVAAWPADQSGVGRVIAVDLSDDVVTPVFADPSQYTGM